MFRCMLASASQTYSAPSPSEYTWKCSCSICKLMLVLYIMSDVSINCNTYQDIDLLANLQFIDTILWLTIADILQESPCLWFSLKVIREICTFCCDRDISVVIRLIIMAPSLTQNRKPSMESWVKSYVGPIREQILLFFFECGAKFPSSCIYLSVFLDVRVKRIWAILRTIMAVSVT